MGRLPGGAHLGKRRSVKYFWRLGVARVETLFTTSVRFQRLREGDSTLTHSITPSFKYRRLPSVT